MSDKCEAAMGDTCTSVASVTDASTMGDTCASATGDKYASAVGDKYAEKMALYENLYAARFSEHDVEYNKTLITPSPAPPCVENWFSRPKRSFDCSR